MARKKKPSIHIKKANRGAFTRKAKRNKMSVSKYARKVLKKGSKASTKTKRQAVFALNSRKWKKRGRKKT